MKKYFFLALLLIALIVLTRLSFYTVDAAEYAYVTVLGEHRTTYDGADQESGAGLKFGWPWPIQQTQRIDRRLQQFDLAEFEQLTHDLEGKTIDKMLLIQAYVCWKIADKEGVDRFVRRIGSVERTKNILGTRINGLLGAAIGQKSMDDLINDKTDEAMHKNIAELTAEKLRKDLLDNLRDLVRAEYGIEIIDIRLRRFNHPPNVRESIFQRIRSERSKKAAEYDSDAALQASNIASRAEEETRKLLARARTEEERIKADTDTEAMQIRNKAYSQDPEFYAFLKKMEKLQSILGDNKTMLLLSTHRPMFDSMFQPPRAHKDKDAPPDKQKKEGK